MSMVMAGLLGVVVLLWWMLHRRRQRSGASSHERWERFKAMGALTLPLLHDRKARHDDVREVAGSARLVFVQVDGESIVIDGLIGPTGEDVRHPFWLKVRRPGTSWMSTTLESLMHKWAAEGSPVEVETRPARDGYQATLTAGKSRMVLEVEAIGGLADAA